MLTLKLLNRLNKHPTYFSYQEIQTLNQDNKAAVLEYYNLAMDSHNIDSYSKVVAFKFNSKKQHTNNDWDELYCILKKRYEP